MKHVEHHLHTRKRIHQLKEKYPHPNPRIRLLDNFVLLIAFIMPFTAIPQLYTIWIHQNAQGVSILTWGLLSLLSIPMFIYGIVHKDKPITLMYFLWIVMDSAVVIGTAIFG